MPLSYDLKFFQKILKKELNKNKEHVSKIKIEDMGSYITVFIICYKQTSIFRVSKENVVEMNNNTKENYSLKYLVKNIRWDT
ncbi:MAG: Unknown protein [uncultured Sulfurovum sp.]|uniref:Uncharacterized protein n=1 Tax=uncultured Sulfurovum sp. TaxID=269237 RepID=A0A6S6S782_9BACT|nr:MAG: Unknown protein [uncultured Sulfurovum sp.]